MIEKIKYHLSALFKSKQMRVSAISFLTALTIAVVTLLNCSIHTIKIFDGEKTYTVRSLNNNVASVMSGLELKSKNYEILKTEVSDRMTSVEISYGFPVYITMGDQTFEINFLGGTVADVLKKTDITVDEFDFIEPSLDTVITETTYIDYTDIEYVGGSYQEKIPYETETVYSNSLTKGTKKTTKQGSEGVKNVYYTEKFVNGVSVEKNVTNTEVVTEAVNAQVTVGKKEVKKSVKTSSDVKCVSTLTPATPIELDKNGIPVNYKSKMTVRATAYTYTGNKCSTGVSPQPGYIAVNPKVIPYGTELYIVSVDGTRTYGYAVAEDTGGAMRSGRVLVDLYMDTESECYNWGRRDVNVYILG